MPELAAQFEVPDSFLNAAYALDIGIEKVFGAELFGNDLSRIIYSGNDYAFRRRAEGTSGLFDLPFMNYKLTGMQAAPDYKWTAGSVLGGVYIPELGTKIRIAPVELTYEGSIWTSRDDQLRYFYNRAIFIASTPTELDASILVEGQTLALPGDLKVEIEFEPTYNEADWLEKNSLHSLGLSMSLKTFELQMMTPVSLTEEVLFSFLSQKSLPDGTLAEKLIAYFTIPIEETEGYDGPLPD